MSFKNIKDREGIEVSTHIAFIILNICVQKMKQKLRKSYHFQ